MLNINIKDTLFFILLVIPFFSFSEYSFDNSSYRELKFLLRFILMFFLIYNLKYIKIFNFRHGSSYSYYLVYLFFSLLSLFFSSDLTYSSIKFFEVVLILLSSIYIVNKFSNDLLSSVKVTSLILVIYLILFYIMGYTIYPSFYRTMGYTGSLRLGGGLINPNLLAYCLLIIGISIDFLKIQYIVKVLFKFIIVYLIFQTVSRSAIIFLIVFFLYQFLDKTNFGFKLFLFPILLFFTFYFNIIESATIFFIRGNDVDNVLTIGGRIPVWIELIENYSLGVHNFFGFGFQCLSANGPGILIESWGDYTELTMAHNNILQVLYGTGLFGLLISVYVIIKFYKEINRILDNNLRSYFRSIFYIFLLFSLVEFGVYGPPNIIVLIFSIYLYAFQKYNRQKIN